MNWLPFISLRSHTAVVAGKDETIAAHQDTIADLRETIRAERETRMATEQRVLDLVKESLIPPPPPTRTPRPKPAEDFSDVPIDLSLIDPSDSKMLASIAAREMPVGSRTNASAMMRSIERLRSQVIEAHSQKTAKAVGAGFVPEGVMSLIDAAESAGKQEASRG